MTRTMGVSRLDSIAFGGATDVGEDVRERLWMLLVGGIPVGVVVAGVGSRLAMLLLRFTSPDHVIGLTSDDGFVIGRFTIGGTYNLLLLGATVGIIGAAAYLAVAPRLIGPMWFRRATTGIASALVVGSGLVNADGIDFRVLKPTWLAIGLFVALPGLFGVVIGPAVDRAEASVPSPDRGLRGWLYPGLLLIAFPISVIFVVVSSLVLIVWRSVARLERVSRIRASVPFGMAVRGVWLAIAGLGAIALVEEITAIV